MAKPKQIPQWQPNQEVREYLEWAVENSNAVTTITGYIRKLIAEDMDKNKNKRK
jgi:hypothetical protein